MALTDTLDDLISDQRIDPQLAIRVLAYFDQAIAESLNNHVKARLSFKVGPGTFCAAICIAFFSSVPRTDGRADRALWTFCRFTNARGCLLQGSLDTYRFCDEVWTFLIKNVTFKMDGSTPPVVAEKVKIVSCNAKRSEGQ